METHYLYLSASIINNAIKMGFVLKSKLYKEPLYLLYESIALNSGIGNQLLNKSKQRNSAFHSRLEDSRRVLDLIGYGSDQSVL